MKVEMLYMETFLENSTSVERTSLTLEKALVRISDDRECQARIVSGNLLCVVMFDKTGEYLTAQLSLAFSHENPMFLTDFAKLSEVLEEFFRPDNECWTVEL